MPTGMYQLVYFYIYFYTLKLTAVAGAKQVRHGPEYEFPFLMMSG